MHTYTLTITKDDFLLEFKSTDKSIVEHELGVWIQSAEEYLDEMPPYVPPEEPVLPEKIELGQIIVEKQRNIEPKSVAPVDSEPLPSQVEEQLPQVPEPVGASQAANFERLEQIQKEIMEKKQAQTYKISNEARQVLHNAIHKPKQSMKEVLAEKQIKEYKTTEMPVPAVKQPSPQPTYVAFEPPTPPVVPQSQPVLQEVVSQHDDFAEVFNQTVVQEQNAPDKFMELLSLQTVHTKFDCLIACAYHLIERENFERFTLKQINTLSKALLEEAIEHDTLKEALERRFIKIVPDYTGIATTMEYTLTDQGIKYFERELSNQD